MTDAGFFRVRAERDHHCVYLMLTGRCLICIQGTSMDQDSRFFNKDKKLIKKMKFPPNINKKVNLLVKITTELD